MKGLCTSDLLGIPKITCLDDFSYQIRLSSALIYKLAQIPDSFYTEINIPKKAGGVRKLACPSTKVKAVQAWILRNILEKVDIHPSATAFKKGMNVTKNISPHLEHRYFLCIDIENFFSSIPYNSINRIFTSLGYNDRVSYLLANICTYKGSLPQGGVTSPALSNIVCINLDRRISSFAGGRNITYTRYADDFTFSANDPERLIKALSTIEIIIKDEGFKINKKKTRVLGPRKSRKITGLVISDDGKFGVGKKQKHYLRALIHKYFTQEMETQDKIKLGYLLQGWFNYLKSVDVNGYKQLNSYWNKLLHIEAAPTRD